MGVVVSRGALSFLIGYEVDAVDAEEAARARTMFVSRRRLGPSLTF